MSFRLVPKSVTLNVLERRNGRVVCVISPNFVAFEACYVKVVDTELQIRGRKVQILLIILFPTHPYLSSFSFPFCPFSSPPFYLSTLRFPHLFLSD